MIEFKLSFKIQWFKFPTMISRFALLGNSPRSWYFLLLLSCVLMSSRILGKIVDPEPKQSSKDVPDQGNLKPINESKPVFINISRKSGDQRDSVKHSEVVILKLNNNNNNARHGVGSVGDKVTVSNAKSTSANTTAITSTDEKPHWDGTGTATVSQQDMDSSALSRLFFVLSGLCLLIIVYVAYRFYRTRKGDTKPMAVRKYGVLTQRTDIEMLPLPLDDEEDDDTVFEVGNHASNR